MTIFQMIVWNSFDTVTLDRLILLGQGGLPVLVGAEPTNHADGEAILIVADSAELMRMIGAGYCDSEPGNKEAVSTFWRVGYVARREPGKRELFKRITARDEMLNGYIIADGENYLLEIGDTDND